jgi:hypothetical protein
MKMARQGVVAAVETNTIHAWCTKLQPWRQSNRAAVHGRQPIPHHVLVLARLNSRLLPDQIVTQPDSQDEVTAAAELR